MEKPALSRMTRDTTRIKEEAFILLIMIISFIHNAVLPPSVIIVWHEYRVTSKRCPLCRKVANWTFKMFGNC
jgi:hypothetical protein